MRLFQDPVAYFSCVLTGVDASIGSTPTNKALDLGLQDILRLVKDNGLRES